MGEERFEITRQSLSFRNGKFELYFNVFYPHRKSGKVIPHLIELDPNGQLSWETAKADHVRFDAFVEIREWLKAPHPVYQPTPSEFAKAEYVKRTAVKLVYPKLVVTEFHVYLVTMVEPVNDLTPPTYWELVLDKQGQLNENIIDKHGRTGFKESLDSWLDSENDDFGPTPREWVESHYRGQDTFQNMLESAKALRTQRLRGGKLFIRTSDGWQPFGDVSNFKITPTWSEIERKTPDRDQERRDAVAYAKATVSGFGTSIKNPMNGTPLDEETEGVINAFCSSSRFDWPNETDVVRGRLRNRIRTLVDEAEARGKKSAEPRFNSVQFRYLIDEIVDEIFDGEGVITVHQHRELKRILETGIEKVTGVSANDRDDDCEAA